MQNSRNASEDITELLGPAGTPPPPPAMMAPAPPPASFPPPMPQAYPMPMRGAYPAGPAAARQHPSVTLQMSPRNLIIGGSVLALIIVVVAAFALLSGNGSHPTPNVYSKSGFPGGPGADGSGPGEAGMPGQTTTTDANGNSVTMGPGAHAVQNADGSTTTTDANGNTVTQGGGGADTGTGAGAPGQGQSPFQGDSSFPQSQSGGYPQQQGGYPQQQGGYPQQQGGYPQQQGGYPQQQGGYNPQGGYPRGPQ